MVELARAAQVSIVSVQAAEGRGARPVSAQDRALIDEALTNAGVTFLADEGGGPGLRARSGETNRGPVTQAPGSGG